MTKHYVIQVFQFILISLILSISGCDKSVDTQIPDLDLSKITETAESPQDFVGSIDRSDWSASNYNSVVFRPSFWVQKSSVTDTLGFWAMSAGDTVRQSLKIYNSGTTDLRMSSRLQTPFFLSNDSVQIQPSSLGSLGIFFILPDTTSTIHESTLILRCSTGDSVVLNLSGMRSRSGSGGPVPVNGLPLFPSLAPAYPNPTDGQITFEFAIPDSTSVVLKIVNSRNELKTIIAQRMYDEGGMYEFSWNANLANGNYRVVFQAGNFTSHGDIKIMR